MFWITILLIANYYWWISKLYSQDDDTLLPFFPHRTEYKAYRDVKPAKMIRARSQYLPPDEKTSLETSYSATYKGQAPLRPAGNKALDRRRIRSLYSEPYIDPIKQVRTRLCSKVQNQLREGRIKRKSLYYCNLNILTCSSHCTSTVLKNDQPQIISIKAFQPRNLISAIWHP